MNLFLVFLLIIAILVGIGFAMDLYAKKKGASVEMEQGIANKSMNQTIHSEESIQNANNNSNPHSF